MSKCCLQDGAGALLACGWRKAAVARGTLRGQRAQQPSTRASESDLSLTLLQNCISRSVIMKGKKSLT